MVRLTYPHCTSTGLHLLWAKTADCGCGQPPAFLSATAVVAGPAGLVRRAGGRPAYHSNLMLLQLASYAGSQWEPAAGRTQEELMGTATEQGPHSHPTDDTGWWVDGCVALSDRGNFTTAAVRDDTPIPNNPTCISVKL